MSKIQVLTLFSFSPAIVELNAAGIMHTNISEANMMVLRTQKAQGILVGFEFAILEDRSSQNKQMRSSHNHVSPVRTTDTSDSRGTMSVVSGLASSDATTHHVASLPLSR